MQHLGIENPIENLTVSEYAIIPLQMSLEEMSLQTQYYEVKYGDFDVKYVTADVYKKGEI